MSGLDQVILFVAFGQTVDLFRRQTFISLHDVVLRLGQPFRDLAQVSRHFDGVQQSHVIVQLNVKVLESGCDMVEQAR